MEFKIDRKSFKLKRAFRITFFILISLCLIALSIALFIVFINLILIPIITTIVIIGLLVILGLLFFFYMERGMGVVYNLDGNTLKTKDYSINLSDVYRLSVYSRKGNNYKVKLRTIFDSYTIDKLENNGIDEIINRIMEVKNGKDI